ncbi:MAG: DNA-directed RNA polymerase subunit alpha [Candidatus Paceibacterota bacterium]
MPLSTNISFPSKPEVVKEEGFQGKYKIDGLYPGYGYTLGNSLRRIILSSLPGTAITAIKIEGVEHEFSTLDGVKEDVITMMMNLKNVRFKASTDEPQTATLSASGVGEVTAGDIDVPGQLEVINDDLVIANITDKGTNLEIEMKIESGLGYVSKEDHKQEKVSAGEIAVDANFSPIRLVNYEVEEMRVGDRTDYNRLEITIETDGTLSPREALETSILTMIRQLQAIIDIQEPVRGPVPDEPEEVEEDIEDTDSELAEFLKTRIENLDLPTRTTNALERASIRTAGGLVKKTRSDLLVVDGLGKKGVDEIEDMLEDNNASLSES